MTARLFEVDWDGAPCRWMVLVKIWLGIGHACALNNVLTMTEAGIMDQFELITTWLICPLSLID